MTDQIITLPIYGRRIIKTEMLEIIVPKNSAGSPKTKILLPDNQNLRYSHLFNIKAYNVTDIPVSPNSVPLVSPNLLQNSFLSLQGYNGKIFCSKKPLCTLKTSSRTVFSNGNLEYHEGQPVNFTGQKVNWPKSYIEISNAAGISAVQNEVYLLKVYYSSLNDKEMKDREANFNNQS